MLPLLMPNAIASIAIKPDSVVNSYVQEDDEADFCSRFFCDSL